MLVRARPACARAAHSSSHSQPVRVSTPPLLGCLASAPAPSPRRRALRAPPASGSAAAPASAPGVGAAPAHDAQASASEAPLTAAPAPAATPAPTQTTATSIASSPTGRLALLFAAAAAAASLAWLAAPEAALAASSGAGQAAAASAASAAPESALSRLLSLALHFDKHLATLVESNPRGTYAVLFAIVFAETGFIVTPFLPGDSLLFAAGALAGMGKLALWPLAATLFTAATLGDALNYAIGKRLGGAALGRGWIDARHVAQTERYYARHGPKTIVLARFVPIVRTFAPFVAGVGSMEYGKFAAYNVGGALLWTAMFVGAGALFGNLPAVKHNFALVVLGIVVVSVVPVVIEVLNARREARAERERGEGGGQGGGATA